MVGDVIWERHTQGVLFYSTMSTFLLNNNIEKVAVGLKGCSTEGSARGGQGGARRALRGNTRAGLQSRCCKGHSEKETFRTTTFKDGQSARTSCGTTCTGRHTAMVNHPFGAICRFGTRERGVMRGEAEGKRTFERSPRRTWPMGRYVARLL